MNKFGAPKRDPDKDATVGGSLVSPTSGGTANWEPPAFARTPVSFYVAERNSYSIFYLTDVDPRGSMGLGGKEEVISVRAGILSAIDYKTGKIAWRRPYYGEGGGGGLLATAGKLLLPAMARVIWWRMMRRPESPSGTRESEILLMRPDVYAGRPPILDRRHRRYDLGVHPVLRSRTGSSVTGFVTQIRQGSASHGEEVGACRNGHVRSDADLLVAAESLADFSEGASFRI